MRRVNRLGRIRPTVAEGREFVVSINTFNRAFAEYLLILFTYWLIHFISRWLDWLPLF